MLGTKKYFAALSNEANFNAQDVGWLILGVAGEGIIKKG